MTQQTGTVRYDLLKHGREIIANKGFKGVWIAGNLIASGDVEDLPNTTEPWREVSNREAELAVARAGLNEAAADLDKE